MPSIVQRAFNGGEVSPRLSPVRLDQARVAYGLRTMLNFVAEVGGAASNRAGTEYLGATDIVGTKLRPFLTGDRGNYMIEWRGYGARIWLNGAVHTLAAVAWDGGTTYARGEAATAGGFGYISLTDGNVANDPTGTTYPTQEYSTDGFWLRVPLSGGLPEAWIPTYQALPSFGPIHFTDTQYAFMRSAQSDLIQYIVHSARVPRQLQLDVSGVNQRWLLDQMVFQPAIDAPTGLAASSGGAGSNSYSYRVTAFDAEDREESLPGTMAALTITGVTAATPRQVTTGTHSMKTGNQVLIEGTGLADIDDRVWTITSVSGTQFTLDGSSGAGTSATGTATRQQASILSAAAPTVANPHTITWTAVSGASSYVIYREINGIYGFIGVADGTTFRDIGYTPDTADTPPIDFVPFGLVDALTTDFPSVVAFFQQRLVFAATVDDPQDILVSRVGKPTNFTRSSPLKADDSFRFTIASNQTRKINALVEISRLLALTAGAEWSIDGDGDGAITPTTIRARQQTYDGAATLPPLPIGSAALYVGDRSNSIREISYSELSQGERSRDLATWAEHLLDGYTIVEWAHQRVPDNIVWMVRSDGVLLGMTYRPEQEVIAWHRHDVGGLVQSLCVIPETARDVLYLMVRRDHTSTTELCIERMAARRFDDITEACFLDSSILWDGSQLSGTTITATTGGGWTVDDDLTLTASASTFVAGDVGQAYRLAAGDATLLVEVTAYTSDTEVTGRAVATVPVAFQGVALTGWARARNYIEGLDHLEGETVGILADGFVGAQAVVDTGRVDLATWAVVIRAGLPYVSRLETLEMENPDGETLLDKQMRVTRVGLLLHETRGGWAGTDTENMIEWKQRAAYGDTSQPIDLFTGLAEVSIKARYTKGGKVIVEQRDPLPMRLTGIIRVGEIGGN